LKPIVPLSAALLVLLVLVAYAVLDLGRGDPVRNEARAKIQLLLAALDAYESDVGMYPTTEEGLQALSLRPANVKNWNGHI
jgi:general secretion pathway protein G